MMLSCYLFGDLVKILEDGLGWHLTRLEGREQACLHVKVFVILHQVFQNYWGDS